MTLKKFMKKYKKEKGDIALIAVFASLLFIMLMALVVDGGLLYWQTSKLQNAVDSSVVAVAHNIGADDDAMRVTAEKYLKENGFDPKKYGTPAKTTNSKSEAVFTYGDKDVVVTIGMKGTLDAELAELNEDAYIGSGYVKMGVQLKKTGLFKSLSGFEALSLYAEGFAKCEMQYVRMPQALNYTIFGNSDEKANTFRDMSVQINGRSNDIQAVANVFENLINGINESIVQPIIGIFGGEENYNKLVNVSTSHAITNGDVHSNSDINIGVATLQASRTKDMDYTGKNDECTCQTKCAQDSVNTYCEVCKNDFTKCEGDTPTPDDYNQVNYTAVGKIYFSNADQINGTLINRIFNIDATNNTNVYVQNQQYLEQTSVALKIIDNIDFTKVTSLSTLKSEYTAAATKYLQSQATVIDSQKDAIMQQVDNLTYLGENKYALTGQKSIVYDVNNGVANTVMARVDAGETINDFLSDVMSVGIDDVATEDTKVLFDQNSMTETYTVEFTKTESDAKASVSVTNVEVTNRNISYMRKNSNVTAKAEAGYSFALIRTFRQNSEYIQIPNMKPYFVRTINRSVKNATTSKTSNADADTEDAVSVKQATKNTQEELGELIESEKTLLVQKGDSTGSDAGAIDSYKDNTYATSESVLNKNTTPLFRYNLRAKTNDSENNKDINDLVLETYGNDDEGHLKFRGETLFKGDYLKTPADYIEEYNQNNASKYGENAVDKFKQDNIDGKYGSSKVQSAKTEFKSTKGYTAFKNQVNSWSFASEAPEESEAFLRDIWSSTPKNLLTQKLADKPSTAADLPSTPESCSEELNVDKPNLNRGYAFTSFNPVVMKMANASDGYAITAADIFDSNPQYPVSKIIDETTTKLQTIYPNEWTIDRNSSNTYYNWINSKVDGNKIFGWAKSTGQFYTLSNPNYWRPKDSKHIWGNHFQDSKNNNGLILYPTIDSNGGKDTLILDAFIACTDRSIIVSQGCGLMVRGDGDTYTNGSNADALYTKNSLEFQHNTYDSGADKTCYDPGYVIVNGNAEVGDIFVRNEASAVIIVNGDLIINDSTYFNLDSDFRGLTIAVTGKLIASGQTTLDIPAGVTIMAGSLDYGTINNNGVLYVNSINSNTVINNNGKIKVSGSLTCTSIENSQAGTIYVGGIISTSSDISNSGLIRAGGSITAAGNINSSADSAVIQTRAINANNIYLTNGAIRGEGKMTVTNEIVVNNGSFLLAYEIDAQTLKQYNGSVVFIGKGDASTVCNMHIKGNYEVNGSILYVENGSVAVDGDFSILYSSQVYINGDLVVGATLTVDGSILKVTGDITASQLVSLNDAKIQFHELFVNNTWENLSTTSVYVDKNISTFRIVNYGTIYAEKSSILASSIKIVSLYNAAGATFIANGDLEVTSYNLQSGHTEESITNLGDIFINGSLTTEYGILVDGGRLYVKGDVSVFNKSGLVNKNAIYSRGENSKIYISGQISSKGNGRRIIVNGTGDYTVFSVFGGSSTLIPARSCIDYDSINEVEIQQMGANVYFGTGRSVGSLYGTVSIRDKFMNNGRLFVYGGFRLACNAELGGNSESCTIVCDNLNLDNNEVKLTNGHRLVVYKDTTINDLTVEGSSKIYGVKTLNITNKTFKIYDDGLVYCGPETTTTNYSVIKITTRDGASYAGTLYYPGDGMTYSLDVPASFLGGRFVCEANMIFNASITLNKNPNTNQLSYVYVGGTAKLNSYNFNNIAGELYLMGNIELTTSAPQFAFNTGCTNYIGNVVLNDGTSGTLTFADVFNCGGNNYIENSVVANTNSSKRNESSDKMAGYRWTSIFISDGQTHIKGDLSVYNQSRGTRIEENATLSCQNFSTYSTVHDYGNFVVLGNFYYTNNGEYSDSENNDSDFSDGWGIAIGKADNSNAMMFIGGESPVTLNCGLNNKGKFYANCNFTIYGDYVIAKKELQFRVLVGEINGTDMSTTRYNKSNMWPKYAPHISIWTGTNSQTHFSGKVTTKAIVYTGVNSVTSVEENLGYGMAILNGGTLYVKDDIDYSSIAHGVNHIEIFWLSSETAAAQIGDKKGSFSIINGYVNNATYGNNNAVLYCGGGLNIGTTENESNTDYIGGTVQNFGSMYVNGDMIVYSNKELAINMVGITAHSKSKTFINGDCFSSGGTITNRDSIFMCDGDFNSKRCVRIAAPETVTGSGKLSEGGYFYVGGDMLSSTMGRTSSGDIGVPNSTWNYMIVYSNTNVYVGGACFTNSIFVPKRNVTFVVDGKETVKDASYNDFMNSFVGKINSAALSLQNIDKDKIKFVVVGDGSINGFEDNGNLGQLYRFYVHGSAYIEETFRFRDMCKAYIYGDFINLSTNTTRNIEIGKSLTSDAADDTWAKEGTFRTAGDSDSRYDYANATYFYVQDGFETLGRLNTYAGATLKIGGKCYIRNKLQLSHHSNVFVGGDLKVGNFIDGKQYSKLFARGSIDTDRYLCMAEHAITYSGGKIDAMASIESKSYSTMFARGDIKARLSTIKIRDKSTVFCAGNMTALSYIELGKFDEKYTNQVEKSECKCTYQCTSSDDANDQECDLCKSDYHKCFVTTPCTCDTKCAKKSVNSECELCSKDYTQCEVITESNGCVCSTHCESGKADPNCAICQNNVNDCEIVKNELGDDETDAALGGTFYIGKALSSYNGYIKEYGFSSVVVGKYVFANKYLTLRSNADMWVLPEAFNNETYKKIVKVFESDGTILGNIIAYIQKIAYEVKDAISPKNGSVYSMGELTLNKNASLMGTWDCYSMDQCLLSHDALIYFGHDFKNYATSLQLDFDSSTPLVGFGSYGGVYTTLTCKNRTAHKNGGYTIYTTSYDPSKTYKCDKCGVEISHSTVKQNVTCPVTIYANHEIDIITTVDMRLTYMVACNGDVNIADAYSKSENDTSNLKQLPNAIASYNGDINYKAMYSKICALFYAPVGNVDLDGWYQEIWGCCIGNKVISNTFYSNFHRFSNWRTMDLQIAEAGNIYMITEEEYEDAEDNVDDEFLYTHNTEDENAGGANLFFDKEILGGGSITGGGVDGDNSSLQ